MWEILISWVCFGMLHRIQGLRSGIAVAFRQKSVRISGLTVKNFAKMEWVAAHGIPPSRLFQTEGNIEITEGNQQRATLNAFSGLGLLENMVEGLSSRDLSDPTPVQRAVVPRLLAGENIVMSASTGSGKTLAYMLPTIQSLVTQEAGGYIRQSMRPRVVVLVPTRELARQVLQEVKSIGHYCKVSSTAVLGGEPSGLQKKALGRIQDIVVASPGRLLKHKEEGNVYFSQVTHVVIDEVDTMLMQGFGNEIRAILRATQGDMGGRKEPAQLVMATATLTPAVKSLLEDVGGFDIGYSDPENRTPKKVKVGDSSSSGDGGMDGRKDKRVRMAIVEVDGAGRALKNHRHLVEEVKGRDKLVVLREVLERALLHVNAPERGMKGKTMLFCNTVDSCRAVEHALREFQIPCLSYHGGLNSRDREANMALFRGETFPAAAPEAVEARVDAKAASTLLVCTDIAARGLDIPDVSHVLMFDHPLNPVDYIHRAGRTGRAGRKGVVTALVTKRDKVLSDAIQGAVARDLPLDNLSSKKRDYDGTYGKLAEVVGRGQKKRNPSARSSGGGGRRGGGGRGGGGRGGGGRAGRSGARGAMGRGAGGQNARRRGGGRAL